MEDEPQWLHASDTEYSDSDSFIASEDDDLEDGLNWDSEDSRPAAPTPNQNLSQNIRNRLRVRIRRQPFDNQGVAPVRPDTQSDNASIMSTDSETALEDEDTSSDETTMDQDHEMSQDSNVTVSLTHSSQGSNHSPPRSPVYRPWSPPPEHVDEDRVIVIGSPQPDVQIIDPPAQEYSPQNQAHSPPQEHVDEDQQVIGIGSSQPEVQIIDPPAEEVNVEALQQNQRNTTGTASNQIDEAAMANSSVLSEGEDASLCSICMDPLTNSGNHRIVCLKCGHIFGQSCLERWIKVGCNSGAKRCPTCNKKAGLKDIRILYLPKVVPLDTVEKDRLIQEKEEVLAEKRKLEGELSRCKLLNDLNTKKYEEKLKVLKKKYEEAKVAIDLLRQGKMPKVPKLEIVEMEGGGFKLTQIHSVEIRKEGSCRVMAYNAFTQELLVSQQSGNTVFAGFGVRVLPSVDFQPTRFVFLHQKMIRDMAFHPEDRDLLLSVSLDRTAKLVDLAASTVVHTFKEDGPLWSCCWEATNPHLLLVGSQLGKVRQYDRRMMDHYLNLWEHAHNTTPVVALASAPSAARSLFPQGGFFSCRLNGVFAYSSHGNTYRHEELSLDGPFMSMRYEHKSQTLLTSSRPSSRNAHAKVNLNLVDLDTEGNLCTPTIHSFNCGSSARVLSRLATLPVRKDTLLFAHHESGRTVNMWSTKSGDLLHSCPINEPVIDMAGISLSNKSLLSTLSDKRVNIYKVA